MISFNEIISDNYIDFSNTYKKLNEEDLKSFRYFENRGLDYVLGIFKPELVYFNLEPFGYYHLDIEDDICWFGVFIIPKYRNRGFSKIIIERSKLVAKKNKINKIHLSVDSNNTGAIKSYLYNGFKKTHSKNSKIYMICNII